MKINQDASVFIFPASFAQQRLYLVQKLAPDNPFYNVSTALRLKGLVNLIALEKAINEIVTRHEILRTNFVMLDNQLVQAISESLTIPLPVTDLSYFPPSQREKQAKRLAIEEARRIYDLAKNPLVRSRILQLDDREYILLLNMHHIITDGWSIGVFIKELSILYTAFKNNTYHPNLLPPLPIQYADFSEWQHQWLQQDPLETQLNYWIKQLDNLPLLNLPTDRHRLSQPTYKGASQSLTLSLPLSEALEKLSQKQGVTMFMTLLAAFKTLLYRYTQQEDVVVGAPIANRNRREIESLIGFFVNTLVLRTNLADNPSFLVLLERVKKITLEAYTHQDIPFEKLVEKLSPKRDLSFNPLFQVSFSWQNTPVETLELPDVNISLLEEDIDFSKLDLEFHLWQEEAIKVKVIYSSDLFDDTTITRMLGHFQTLLESIVNNPQESIATLPIFPSNSPHPLLNSPLLVGEGLGVRDIKTFHHEFETQVKHYPNAVAVVCENEKITYRQLNNKANQLAHYLQQLQVKPEVIVGICLEPSINMIVAILAIHKAGAAYLPLDPNYPSERLNFMVSDAQVSLVLTQEKLSNRIPNINNIICLDRDWQIISKQSQVNPTPQVNPNNLAYLIYTSGSTGKPKGVLIEQLGLSNLIAAQKEIFNIRKNYRILQFASLSFDASIFEIVMALCFGASLYIFKKDGQNLSDFLRKNTITHATLPPAVLEILPCESLPALHTVIAAGESCLPEIVQKWAKNRNFYNAYGLTETTVWATISQKENIGRPILNTQVDILDKYLQPVPIGVIGELYISGEGLARGYINHTMTTERFIYHPLLKKRLYKTGDQGRYLNDGNIEYKGRIDSQVKIRGLRIELTEIEALLTQHQAIQQAVVVASSNGLVAYVVADLAIALATLRDYLLSHLPQYMMPYDFIFLDSLPLTANGKVDRAALKIPQTEIKTTKVTPRNATETAIALIWCELLKLDTVGVYDNFFDNGGNSLLAIQLISKLNSQFQKNLSLSYLFLNPTIAGIASHLTTSSQAWSPLVTISQGGSKSPFFCVHPIFGVVFPYYELASHLGGDRPFYALQPLGFDGHPPLTDIKDMAKSYIEALRKVQPTGPYYLGGWSFGGLVAFEMAQQLIAANQQVALLALLDTSLQGEGIHKTLKFLLTTGIPYILPFLFSAIKHIQIKDLALWPIWKVYQANCQAVAKYIPQSYSGSITLFTTNQTLACETNRWSKLAEKVEVCSIPGNHLTMLNRPNVQVLAKQLLTKLNITEREKCVISSNSADK